LCVCDNLAKNKLIKICARLDHPENQDSLRNISGYNKQLPSSIWVSYEQTTSDLVILQVNNRNQLGKNVVSIPFKRKRLLFPHVCNQGDPVVLEIPIPMGGRIFSVRVQRVLDVDVFVNKKFGQLVDGGFIPFHDSPTTKIFKIPKVGLEPTRFLGTRF